MSRIKSIILVSILSMICLTGCLPDHISETQRAEVIEKGTELITSYLMAKYDDFSIGVVDMARSTDRESHGSNIAVSSFAVDGCRYNIFADISTSQVYVDYDSEYWNEVFGERIRDIFERRGIVAEFTVYSYTADSMIESENKCEKDKAVEPVLVNIGTAIPANMGKEEALKYMVENVEILNLDVCYSSDRTGDIDVDMYFDLYEGLNIKGNIHLINISEEDYAYYKENDEFFVTDIASVREVLDIEHIDAGFVAQYDMMNTYQEEGICINYVWVRKTYNSVEKSSNVIDYDCPANINGDKIKLYQNDDRCPYAYVYFIDRPTHYSVSIIENSGDNSGTKLRVPLKMDPNGYYILYDKPENQPANTRMFSNPVTIDAF